MERPHNKDYILEFWTIIDNSHAGPFTAGQLADMGISPETLVWHEGLADWTPARDIPALAYIFAVEAEVDDAPVAIEENQAAPVDTPRQELVDETESQPGYGGEEPQASPQQQAPYAGYQPYAPYNAPQPQQPQYVWQPGAPAQPECPPTYLVWSIIVTVLCCLVGGVAAIICSTQVKSAYNRGDLKKARKMSEWAQWCIILSIVLGILWLPFQLAFSSFSLGEFNI